MKDTDIYQTLEDRQNYEDVEEHGPYFCYARYANGNPKSGVKEPWLGEGYYFWDTRIADARWWGDTVYISFAIRSMINTLLYYLIWSGT